MCSFDYIKGAKSWVHNQARLLHAFAAEFNLNVASYYCGICAAQNLHGALAFRKVSWFPVMLLRFGRTVARLLNYP